MKWQLFLTILNIDFTSSTLGSKIVSTSLILHNNLNIALKSVSHEASMDVVN